ncbi:MAG TPA: methyltransferase domain-containing protein [Dongiaceae bacterium]|jgi:SAM-dependent methyltransferase|nr:methyltransferase domain-containing protein [Dongiaceae bacterium]
MQGNVEDVFESGAYWREYYASLGHENREVGEFLAEVTRKLSPGGGLRILDAGCGPTVLYWGVFVSGRNELYGFDLSHANVADNHRRIETARAGIVDAGLIEAARHALGLFGSTQTAEELVADKARQVMGLKVADLSKPWPYAAEKFDLVQSCFALETLPDWDAFDRALAEARLVLKPGGTLALANTAHGKVWICDDRHFETLFVTAEEMRWRIADAGFALIELRDIESADVSWRDQGYGRLLLTHAVKA